MCWLCAHAVTEHGGTIADAHERVAACACSAHDIYPADVIARRGDTHENETAPAVIAKSWRWRASITRVNPRTRAALNRVASRALALSSRAAR